MDDRNRPPGERCPRAYVLRGKEIAQEGQAVDGDGVLGRGERAPDRSGRGDRLVLRGEGFDHDRAVVARVADRVAEADPVDVVGAGRTAIVRGGMDVRQPGTTEAERLGEVLL